MSEMVWMEGGSERFRRRTFWKGEEIFSEGDRGICAYLIVTGAVEISSGTKANKVVLGEIHEKGLFGEMALIDDSPRMATATALENTACIIIPDYVFAEKLVQVDPFTRALLRLLSENVRSVSDRYIHYIAEDASPIKGPPARPGKKINKLVKEKSLLKENVANILEKVGDFLRSGLGLTVPRH